MARTIVLNFGHIQGKQLFANQEGREHEVIKTLCCIKTLVSWNSEKVGRVCRERCGGGTYLLVNRIGLGVGGAHSGMTAEGDNSVLMQKVVKDILQHTREGIHVVPTVAEATKAHLAATSDITQFVALKNLIYMKEAVEI